MASFEFLAIILTGIGLTVSILYYTFTLQNANKTRQAQLFIQFYRDQKETRFLQAFGAILQKGKVENIDVLEDPEYKEAYYILANHFEGIGVLVHKGLIDIDTINNVSGLFVEASWAKFKPIVEAYRGADFSSNGFNNWEYLAMAVKKKRNEQQGESWAFLDSLWKGSQYK